MIRIHLSKLLGERKMTQADLARKTGIRAGTINDLYWGLAVYIKIEHLDKICTVLSCSISDLIEFIPDK